jgi:NCS1 family nucleobase:cation symporter-1
MSTETASGQESVESHASWPAHPRARTWTWVSLLMVCGSFAAATWAFPVGGAIALFLPMDLGVFALCTGTFVATVMVAVAAGPVAGKYGLDTVMSTRPQLGTHGSAITLVLLALAIIGWNSILLVLLGRSGAEILVSIGVIGEDARYTVRILITIAAIAAIVLMLRGGAAYLARISLVVASLVFVLGTWILVVVIGDVGWDTIKNAKPVAAYPSDLTNYMVGVDLGLAAQLSFLPSLGALSRLVPGMRKATWPIILGLALPLTYLAVIGLFAGLAVPDSVGDPSVFLVETAGTPTAVVLLLFTILANVGTCAIGTYGVAIGIFSVPAAERRLSWNATTLLLLVPVLAITALWPDDFYDNAGTFMAFLGVAFAPLAGIMIVDFHILRRQRLSLDALYGRNGDGGYRYLGGFNPAGVVALLAGFGTYLYLLDPYKLTPREPYKYISAGIPSAIVAGVVFLVLTRLFVMRRGWGGYDRAESK